jgi:tripartite-type tricarboxylate transporter receptor subunit TctC
VAVKAAHAPDVKAALLKDGLEVTGTTSAEYAAIIKIEIAKWIQVAKAAGITAQ